MNTPGDVLPTQGASGGARGLRGSGPPIWSGHSEGGGMIWLSGFEGLTFGSHVRLDASGTDGVAGKEKMEADDAQFVEDLSTLYMTSMFLSMFMPCLLLKIMIHFGCFFAEMISNQDKSNHFASGGGSGGQILIFAGPYLKAPDDDFPIIKATGSSRSWIFSTEMLYQDV